MEEKYLSQKKIEPKWLRNCRNGEAVVVHGAVFDYFA